MASRLVDEYRTHATRHFNERGTSVGMVQNMESHSP